MAVRSNSEGLTQSGSNNSKCVLFPFKIKGTQWRFLFLPLVALGSFNILEDLLLFFIFCNNMLTIFGLWTVGHTKQAI